jgi:hypothetical protein
MEEVVFGSAKWKDWVIESSKSIPIQAQYVTLHILKSEEEKYKMCRFSS